MPFTVDYNQETDCVMVAVQGELDLALLQKLAAEVFAIVEKTGCTRVLNDLRGANPAKLSVDIYDMPKTAKNAGVAQTLKRALLVAEDTSEFRFLETVFINQGHQVKMFTKPDDAKEWLFDE